MKNIPQIRFPEFSGEWVEKRLGEICEFFKGKGISKSDIISGKCKVENKKLKKCIHYGELFTIYKESINFIVSYTEKKDGFIGKKGDLLFPSSDVTPDGLAKVSSLNIDNVLIGNDVIIARCEENINSNFLSYQINQKKKEILKLVTGSTIKHIYPKDLKSLKIHIPESLEEQQKIANFLSSIDEKIDIVSKKIEKLKEYKKGLLQKLLNVKNGKPELRFPEFSGEWVEKRLGEICEFFNGKSYESCIVENGQYYLITLNSITLEGKLSQEHKKINVTDNFLQKNDLVIIMSDVAKGDFLGKVSIIPENNKYILNQRVGGIRINKDYHYLFIAYYINNNQKYFKKIGQGSSQKNISTNDIKNFIIHIPPTIEEQQKIASFLSNIDEKIELNEQKLTKLKEYKRGLLQKMFV